MKELEALSKIDECLSQVTDKEAIIRIVRWVNDKYSKDEFKEVKTESTIESNLPLVKQRIKKKMTSTGKSVKPSAKSKNSYTVVKDLVLTPSGKQSFKDFYEEKKPSSVKEKCVVCVYYLSNTLGVNVSIAQVFTCFKTAGWRLPANLKNMLHQAASEGWLDSKDQDNIKMTPIGDNLIEQDLPKSK